MTRREVASLQRLLNAYFKPRKLGYKPLRVDGRMGKVTKRRIALARYYLGAGDWRRSDVTDALLAALKRPRKRWPGFTQRRHLRRFALARKRQGARRRKLKAKRSGAFPGFSAGPPHWGGARYVVEACWRAVGRPSVSSMKRSRSHSLSRSNPASDHNEANRTAFAHDWPAYGRRGDELATRAGQHFGVRRIGSYASFHVRRAGRVFRCQLLWRVRGHHDHNHLGAKA